MSDGLKLLRAIISTQSSGIIHDVAPSLFVAGPELDAYNFVREHYSDYDALPNLNTLEDYIEMDLPQAPEPVDYYVNACLDRECYNNVRPEFQALQNALRSGNMEHVRETCAVLARVSRQNLRGDDILSLESLVHSVTENYQMNAASGELPGIQTGWESVDEETQGWQRGDLVVFAARPAMGKTFLLLHSCHNAWRRGHSVLFASMEMSSNQIGYRFIAMCAGINPSCYRKGMLSTWAERRLALTLEELHDDRRFHLYSGEFKDKTTEALDNSIQELSPDCAYLDGLYLMRSSNAPRNTNRYEKVAYVVDELKQVALRRDRPIVSTTQFGRGAGARGSQGDMENIGYTDTLSTHASIIIGVKVPATEVSGNGAPLRYPRTRSLDFLKGREGERGSVLVNFSFSPLSFAEIPETDAEQQIRMVAEEEANSPRRNTYRRLRAAPDTDVDQRPAGETTAFMRGRRGLRND